MRVTKMAWAALVAAGVFTAACGGSTGDGSEPAVATMRLTITPAGGAAQVVNVNSSGVATPASITLPVNTNATIASQWLRADGSADPLVTATTFRLEVRNLPGSMTFTRTDNFSGTLRATAAGNFAGGSAPRFELFHIQENHEDFGPFSVPVTVTP
ncbi:MAG: hypothetical protein NW201_11275 [Gemmatimonadales bacterium]|nr:hypothetical protein [Gemmatimonadales bacterium]